MQDLAGYFERFIHNISLGEPQVSRMESTAGDIMRFLRNSYELPESRVFLQGSYPNNTAIEPVDGGEYDVDIVAICADGNRTATAALEDLEARFRANGNYAARVVPRTPCVRLEYAEDAVGKFHVDVVPVRPNTDGQSIAPLDAPRRNSNWHETAPAEYTDWCRQQGVPFMRTVKVMKRWRDEQQSVRGAIKSIVLQVLVSQCMPRQLLDDQERLVETFRRLHTELGQLSRPPVVPNPVLPTENLAARWTQSSFDNFKRELEEAVVYSDRAAAAGSKLEAIDAWRELLGEDFPAMRDADLGLQVSDYSHAWAVGQKGWRLALDPRYRVTVTAAIRRTRRAAFRSVPEDNVLFPGSHLRFTATITSAPRHVSVWWQVANTGGHARSDGGLRGEIFKAKLESGKPSTDERVNYETTRYTGVHLIRALLVRDDAVVAMSDWRQVHVFSPAHPFRP